ncbi:hypothetical protein PF011_g28972 [Phytophthora fragariae]|uniref:Cysteine-rich transmembrane CYSTM domain-containing protein n=1 Tax=Phytophthora fragariae TaxID=53985 RepID=A0A6A3H3C8_9STRA|nr:hypothetical protein PF011_g28972 [Phytophthora fragariae]KAE9272723.1 hypothetical protein PF008_g30027 [Phytophthora fragariae]
MTCCLTCCLTCCFFCCCMCCCMCCSTCFEAIPDQSLTLSSLASKPLGRRRARNYLAISWQTGNPVRRCGQTTPGESSSPLVIPRLIG